MSKPLLNLTEIPFDKLEILLQKVQLRMLLSIQTSPEFCSNTKINASTAASYHLQAGGQRFRAKLGLAAASALGLSERDAVAISACVELLHNASLIHDDLQDGDVLRRGLPTVWSKFGKNLALCCGDLMLSSAYSVLADITKPEKLGALLALVHQRTSSAISGQCADLEELNAEGDTVEQYLAVAKAKSGALLGLPLELALLVAESEGYVPVAQNACENFAVSYQILDDIQDLEIDIKRARMRRSPLDAAVLNIVLLMKINSSMAEAITNAVELAMEHLAKCEATAARLPQHAGSLLISYCAIMRSKLQASFTFITNCEAA